MENFQSFLRNAFCYMFYTQFEKNFIEISSNLHVKSTVNVKNLYTKRRLILM